MFQLHPQLQDDTVLVGCFDLSLVLLHRDSQYPWCILVPQREGVAEIYQLVESDQQQLLRESSRLSQVMGELFSPDKLNLAAIGNIVPQLHMHHVARFKNDPCWPKPVWGALPLKPYRPEQLRQRVQMLQKGLEGGGFWPNS